MTVTYPFTEQEFKDAVEAWGCNCGPSALAFACQVPLEAALHAIPQFDRKRYTSPTMMRAALDFLGVGWRKHRPETIEAMCHERMALVRVQWTGPWTAPGSNPKWAYRHTHWIAAWSERGVQLVFDCNGGMRTLSSWMDEIVPILTAYPRADGAWRPTHIWRLKGPPVVASAASAAARRAPRTPECVS